MRAAKVVNYEQFRISLVRLQEQYANYRQLDPSLPEVTQEAVADSVIHRFQRCYGYMWKALKRHLVEVLGIPDAPNSPKPVLRLAFESHLLHSPFERWLGYTEHLVRRSHDGLSYTEDYLAIAGDFIDDAAVLYETMTGQPWAQSVIRRGEPPGLDSARHLRNVTSL